MLLINTCYSNEPTKICLQFLDEQCNEYINIEINVLKFNDVLIMQHVQIVQIFL